MNRFLTLTTALFVYTIYSLALDNKTVDNFYFSVSSGLNNNTSSVADVNTSYSKNFDAVKSKFVFQTLDKNPRNSIDANLSFSMGKYFSNNQLVFGPEMTIRMGLHNDDLISNMQSSGLALFSLPNVIAHSPNFGFSAVGKIGFHIQPLLLTAQLGFGVTSHNFYIITNSVDSIKYAPVSKKLDFLSFDLVAGLGVDYQLINNTMVGVGYKMIYSLNSSYQVTDAFVLITSSSDPQFTNGSYISGVSESYRVSTLIHQFQVNFTFLF